MVRMDPVRGDISTAGGSGFRSYGCVKSVRLDVGFGGQTAGDRYGNIRQVAATCPDGMGETTSRHRRAGESSGPEALSRFTLAA